MRTSKKILSFFLAVVMVVTTCSVGFTAFAGSNDNSVWKTTGVDADSAFNSLNDLADELPALLMGNEAVATPVYEKGAKKLGKSVSDLTDAEKQQIVDETTLSDILGLLQPKLLGLLASTSKSDFFTNYYKTIYNESHYGYLDESTGAIDFYSLFGLCRSYMKNESLSKETRDQLETWLYGEESERTLTDTTNNVTYSKNSLWYIAAKYAIQADSINNMNSIMSTVAKRYNGKDAAGNSIVVKLGDITIGDTYENATLEQYKKADFQLTDDERDALKSQVTYLNNLFETYNVALHIDTPEDDGDWDTAIAECLYYTANDEQLGVKYLMAMQVASVAIDGGAEIKYADGMDESLSAKCANIDDQAKLYLAKSQGCASWDELIQKICPDADDETKTIYEQYAVTLDIISNFYPNNIFANCSLSNFAPDDPANSPYYAEMLKGLAIRFGKDASGNALTLDQINSEIKASLPSAYVKGWTEDSGEAFIFTDGELEQLYSIINDIFPYGTSYKTRVSDLFADGTLEYARTSKNASVSSSSSPKWKLTVKLPSTLYDRTGGNALTQFLSKAAKTSNGESDLIYNEVADAFAGDASANKSLAIKNSFKFNNTLDIDALVAQYGGENLLVKADLNGVRNKNWQNPGILEYDKAQTKNTYSKAAIQSLLDKGYDYAVYKVADSYLNFTDIELSNDSYTREKTQVRVTVAAPKRAAEITSDSVGDIKLTDAEKDILNGKTVDLTGSAGTELVNYILNGYIDEYLGMDLIAEIIAQLVKSPVDLASSLHDVWANLIDDPIKTLIELMPTLLVFVNELLEPALLTGEGNSQYDAKHGSTLWAIVDMIPALRSVTYDFGSYVGMNKLGWDLNELLPDLMHWLQNDGSYDGKYWNDGNELIISLYNTEDSTPKTKVTYTKAGLINGDSGADFVNYDITDQDGNKISYDSEAKTYTYTGTTGTLEQALASAKTTTVFTANTTIEAGTPYLTGIYLVDKALKYAKISDLEDMLKKSITTSDGQVAEGLYEVIIEFADLFTTALDKYVDTPELVNKSKGLDDSGRIISTGLNNLTVGIPDLLDVIEDLGAEKYGVDKDAWTYSYDGKIADTWTHKTSDGDTITEEGYNNVKLSQFKTYAENPNTVEIFDLFADIFVQDWLNAILGLLNNVIGNETTNSQFDQKLPIVTGLLQSMGGISETSALTDLLNSIFNITRESKYSFTFEKQETGFVGLNKDNAYFIITNISTLIDIVRDLIGKFSQDDSGSGDTGSGDTGSGDTGSGDTGSTTTATGPVATSTSKADLSAYDQSDKDTVNSTIDALDSMLSEVLADSSINGFAIDKTSNIVTGVISLLSNYIGADASNQTIDLLNTYLYYLNGEDTRSADADGNVKPEDIYTNDNLTTVVARTFALVETLVASLTEQYAYDYKYSDGTTEVDAKYNLISEAVNGLISPDSLATRMQGTDYADASSKLQKIASWSDAINADGTLNVSIDWNIQKGNKDQFFNAFATTMRLISSVAYVLLIDSGIYENALYPALNAIASKSGITIDTPAQLAKETADGYHDEIILALINHSVEWLDAFLKKPATTLLNLLTGLAAVLDDSDTSTGTLASIVSGTVTPVVNEINGLTGLLELTSNDLGALSPTFAKLIKDAVDSLGDGILGKLTTVNDKQELGLEINSTKLSGNNIIPIVNTLLAQYGLKLDNIDWNKLSKYNNAGEALMYLLEYLVDTVTSNDNLSAIASLIGSDNVVASLVTAIQEGKINAKALLGVIYKVLKVTQNPTLFAWTFEHYLQEAAENFTYPTGISKAQADEAAQDIDKVINNIFPVLKSLGIDLGGTNLQSILNAQLFTNATVTKLVVAIYSGISSNETVANVLGGMGVVSSPAEVAALLTDASYGASYSDAAAAIAKLASWSSLSTTAKTCPCNDASCTCGNTTTTNYPTINWGFTDGAANAQQGFVNALAAALRPFYGLINTFLNSGSADLGGAIYGILQSLSVDNTTTTDGGVTYSFKNCVLTLTVKDAANADSKDSVIKLDFSAVKQLKLYGTNAYNSAIIPLLEALQATNIKTDAEYKADVAAAKDNLLLDILNPIMGSDSSVLSKIAANPLVTISTLLPNLAVYIDANGLSQLVANFIAPVTQVIYSLNDVVDVNSLLSYVLASYIEKNSFDGITLDGIVNVIAGKTATQPLGDVVGSLLGMKAGSLTVDLSDLSTLNIQDAVAPIINLVLAGLTPTALSTKSCTCSYDKCPGKLTDAQIKENEKKNETNKALYAALNQIKLGDIDWNLLASFGTRVTYTSKATDTNGNALTGKKLDNVDYGKTLITVLRYVFDTVKNNINPISSIISASVTDATLLAVVNNVITQVKTHTTDQLIVALYYFFVGENAAAYWDFTGYKTKASSFTYPNGVKEEDVAKLIAFLDGIIDDLDLEALLDQYLYTDSLINTLAKLIYTNLEKTTLTINNNKVALNSLLAIANIDASSATVASLLTNSKYGETSQFATAAKTITAAGSWQKVDFDKLSWGVKDQKTFLNALVAILRPFYGVLDAIVADGQLNLLEGITIPGSNAYVSAIVPLLEAIGCENIPSYETYLKDKSTAYDNLLLDVLKPLFGFVDDVVESPVTTLAEALPNIGLFIGNNGVTQFVVNLITPVTEIVKAVNPIIDVDALLYDLTKVELNGKKISITKLDEFLGQYTDGGKLIATINTLLKSTGITIPEIDWLALAALGTTSKANSAVKCIGDRLVVTANSSKVVIALLRYVLNTVLNNGDAIKGLLGKSYTGAVKDILDMLFKLKADDLISLIFKLVNVTQSHTEVYWAYKHYSSQLTKFKYPDGITAEDAENAVGQLDDAVQAVMALLAGLDVVDSSDLKGVVSGLLFTNSTVTSLAKALYGALDTDKVSPYLEMAGIDVSTKGVAKLLTDKSYGKTYSSAAKTLKSVKSWKKITKVNWGFKDGSKNAEQGFINALTAVLRPFINIAGPFLNGTNLELGTILLGVIKGLNISSGNKKKHETLVTLKKGKLKIQTYSNNAYSTALELNLGKLNTLKKLNFYGSNGYENSIIPLLDVLQVNNSEIKSYDQYVKDCKKAKDYVLLDILNPLMSFVDEVLEAPFDKLTSVLPNIAYFIDNGGIGQLLDNLLSPLTEVLKDAKKDGIDIDKIIKLAAGKDLGSLIMGLLKIKNVKFSLKLTNLTACNIGDVLVPIINSLLKSTGIKLPAISWATLASHGEVVTSTSKALNREGKYTNKEVVADKGETLIAVLRYVSDLLIKNAKSLKNLINSIDAVKKNDMIKSIVSSVFGTIGIASKDQIVQAIFYFLIGEPTNAFWDYTAYETGEFDFSYPEGMDTDFLKTLPLMLDGLVSGLVEGGLNSLIGGFLYKDSIINSLLTGLYGAIEKVNITDGTNLVELLAMTDIDFSTSNVASLLTNEAYGKTYSANASVIAAAGSWSKVNTDNLKWGVKDRDSFFQALVAVLRPIYGVLDVLLNDAYLGLFDIVRIPGSNGYTSTIVPLLEAFSCYNVKTQYQYREDIKAEYDSILLDIINPLWDKVEDILNAPLETLFAMLPNLSLFIGNDGLCQILDNLLTPVSALLDAMKPVVNLNDLIPVLLDALNVDLDSLLAKVGITNFKLDIYDINETLKPVLGGDAIIPLVNNILGLIKIGGTPLGLKLNDINWLQCASHGKTIVSASQAATYGSRIYVEGDSSETLIAVLRYLIDTINTGDNFDKINELISGLLGDGVSSSISDVINQVLGMLQGDTDEVIASLVDLLNTLA